MNGRGGMPMEISEEVKAAYGWCKKCHSVSSMKILADFARDTLARALKAEFHKPRWYGMDRCLDCDGSEKSNHLLHTASFADWQAEADRLLRGE